MSCVWINDGSLMVQVCMCVSIYGVCLVGKAQQWCLVEDVGTLWKWKSGFGKFIENIVWLWF